MKRSKRPSGVALAHAVIAMLKYEALPTLEELAEILEPVMMDKDYALRIADALLARLRPAWEAHDKCIEEIQRDQLAVAERENELHAEKDRQIDALRADLRACAEALEKYGGHLDGCLDNPCVCGLGAALARPGVQEALPSEPKATDP